MCGIAGLIAGRALDASMVSRMTDPIVHRGPDDQGVWLDEAFGVGLGHRRLAIIDLSPQGHQPMLSSNGRYVIAFNGEIYNHQALRRELESAGRASLWRGHSDTETLIECIAVWGLSATLTKCRGMFALALWDRKKRELSLARDRFGEKPLYYGWVGDDFLFGSELKAFRTHPGFSNPVSLTALRSYTSLTYVPTPLSIFEDIYKLQPGCILSAHASVAQRKPSRPPVAGGDTDALRIEEYWSYRDTVAEGLASPILQPEEALERLERTLIEAIKLQSVADVPLGAFLSGGIDSSLIAALYQSQSSTPIRTFSIGFEEAAFNEAEHARTIAAHLGTNHNEHYVTAREAQEVIPFLPSMYDEPFADSSQVPTHIVSRFAREQVIVALSGDGGDELFGGYNRHFQTPRLWGLMKKCPQPLRGFLGHGLATLPPRAWNELSRLLNRERPAFFGQKVKKTLEAVGSAADLDDLLRSMLDEWSGEQSPVLGEGLSRNLPALDVGVPAADALRVMYGDAVSYLPDDILCKVDRAGMAVSLETRIPFLDHRVAELAARIPLSMKIEGGTGKVILRKLLYKYAPSSLFARPKSGFAIPVGEWLKGPLRAWAEALLDRRLLAQQGYFDPDPILRRWKQHLAGERDSTAAIWAILMFQAWHQNGASLNTVQRVA
jgi:asparagine synthase (glutamine-hydrolysing)